MKTKWIFGIVGVMAILSIFSISQGADRFYYGCYGGREYPDTLKDSMRFNIVLNVDIADSNIQSIAACSLRAMVHARDEDGPTHWAYYSHYTLWEAEGLEGSYFKLSYDGGTLVNDASASGGKAMCFSGPGTPGLIQTGPSYYQEREYGSAATFHYTAEFRLKYFVYTPLGAMGPGPPTPLCSLMVVDSVSGSILKHTVINKSDFAGGGGGPYQTFKLENYTVPWTAPDGNRIEFQIYWFGIGGRLFIDYVKVYDENGEWLMGGHQDSAIMAYVSQDWVHTTIPGTEDTVVYRWCVRDEPPSIDLFATNRYVDSLLREASAERVGFTAFNKYRDDTLIHEYLLRQDPEEFNVDPYPTRLWAPTSSGAEFQESVSTFINLVNKSKQWAENYEKDLWVTIQAFYEGYKVDSPGDCRWPAYCDSGVPVPGCYCSNLIRPPTPNELRLQTFLVFCHGADGMLNYCYHSRNWFANGKWYLKLGLYNYMDSSTTDRWQEIKEFTGPRAEKLGAVLNQLDWQGACSDDSVGSFTFRHQARSSYIDSVTAIHEPHWVEVGFFTADTGQYANYFMLVNRECLESEADNYYVFFTDEPGPYRIRDMYIDSVIAVVDGAGGEFTVHLEAGEGKLFRVEPYVFSSHVIQVPYDSSCIQCAIDGAENGDTVLVAPGTYNEHINFHGKGIIVGSYYILFPEPSYICSTVIEVSYVYPLDTASVVTFASGEDSSSAIAGFQVEGGWGTRDAETGNRYGGGVYCYASSPVIRNNRIYENDAFALYGYGYGGGICCRGNDCAPTVSSNYVFGNRSNCGGGIYCLESSPRIVNNLIEANGAFTLSGAWGEGGGICFDYSTPLIVNNVLSGNTAQAEGGGIYSESSTPLIVNNALSENVAEAEGGGIALYGPYAASVINNIIYGSDPDGVYLYYPWSYDISYCDFWQNGSGDTVHFAGSVPACYGDTSWGSNRNGIPCDTFWNIFRDPTWDSDLRPDSSSACVDAGDNDAPGLPETDFDGNPRIVDGNGDDSAFVDMGAYEYQPEGSGGAAKIAAGDTEDTESKSSSGVPEKFSLSQNYPNPFNPTTALEFDVAEPVRVRLKVYNILGQQVKALVDEERAPGSYTVHWDGKDNNGQAVSSGIYFYKLDAGDFTEVKKMVLLK